MTRQLETAIAEPPRAAAVRWPGNVPDLGRAERALLAALEGSPPPEPELAPLAASVAAVLSPIERSALTGGLASAETTPIRRAAAMRVRAGFAIASAPPGGSVPDPKAVASLLGEIDDLLFEVNALASAAQTDIGPALRACRNSLVKEAIDFSEISQRFSRVEVEDLAAPPRRSSRQPRTRRARPAQQGRAIASSRRQLAVGIVVALLAAALLLALRLLTRP